MTAKAETTFIHSIHKVLPGGVYREKQNNPYRGGQPDVYYEGNKDGLWVEYKFIVIPKRATTLITPDLSALQLQWLKRCYDNGLSPWVVVGCKTGGVLLTSPTAWSTAMATAHFLLQLKTRQVLADLIKDRTMKC